MEITSQKSIIDEFKINVLDVNEKALKKRDKELPTLKGNWPPGSISGSAVTSPPASRRSISPSAPRRADYPNISDKPISGVSSITYGAPPSKPNVSRPKPDGRHGGSRTRKKHRMKSKVIYTKRRFTKEKLRKTIKHNRRHIHNTNRKRVIKKERPVSAPSAFLPSRTLNDNTLQ